MSFLRAVGIVLIWGTIAGRVWAVETEAEKLPPGALARLGTTRFRHPGGIVNMARLPDGRMVITSGGDSAVRFWDAATGKERAQIGNGPLRASLLAFSPDGRTLAIGGNDNRVQLWDVLSQDTGRPRGQLVVPANQVHSITFSPDGLYLAASYKNGVLLCEAASGQEVASFRCDQNHVHPLVFSPDGRVLASCGGRTVLLWDVTGRQVRGRRPGVELIPPQLEVLWEDLASSDAGRAHRALWTLVESPQQAVPLLAKHLRPTAHQEDRLIRQWVEQLSHTDVPTRRAAETALEELGEAAGAVVRKARATTPSAEVYARSGLWLQGLTGAASTPPMLRRLRAVAALEHIAAGTKDTTTRAAQRLLEQLAGGEPRARLTAAAQAALNRRNRRGGQQGPAPEKVQAASVPPAPARLLRQLGKTMFGPREVVASVAFRPRSTTLALAVTDNTVRLWDAPRYKELRRWPAPVHVRTPLAFSPDGKVLVAGSSDGLLRRWDVDADKELPSWSGHAGGIGAVAFSGDGKLFASGGEHRLVVWDANNGKTVWQGAAPRGISGLAFSPDGKTLAGCSGAVVRLWDAVGGKERRQLPGASGSRWLAFTADGKYLLGRGPRRDAVLWDLATGKAEPVSPGFRLPIHALALSPDGRWPATGWATGELMLGDIKVRRNRRSLLSPGPVRLRPHPDPNRAGEHIIEGEAEVVTTIAFSSDGKYLAAAGADRRLRVFDLTTFAEVPKKGPPLSPVRALAFRADGRSLVAASDDHLVRTWAVRTGKLVRTAAFRTPAHRNMALSANGELLVRNGMPRGKLFLCRTTPKRESMRVLDAEAAVRSDVFFPALAVAVNADGTLLATAGSATVRVWTAEGRLRLTLKEVPLELTPLGMAFSPDGRTLAVTGSSHAPALFDLTGGRRLPPPQGRKGHLGPPAFSPDGRTVYASYGPEAFCQWEVATGKFRGPLVEVPGGSGPVCVSPDGRTLVTATRDWALHFWDARTGQSLGRMRGHTGAVRALVFSPDGKLFASAGDDGTALVWEVAGRPGAPIVERRAAELARLWDELGSSSGLRSCRAMLALERTGEQAVALFERHLRPAGGPDAPQLAGLVADLDNDSFAARERATQELERLGATAHPTMRKALSGRVSLEARQRIEKLLALPARPVAPPNRLPALRALEVLEHLATPRARRLIASLAGGDAGDLLTRESQAAQRRLAARPVRSPSAP